jgi:lipopolysaccharide export system protein LptA
LEKYFLSICAMAVLLLASCAHLDDAKYDKIFFESVEAKVSKAEGRPYQPSPSATADKYAPAATQAATPAAVEQKTTVAVNTVKTPESKPTPTLAPIPAPKPVKKNKFKIKSLEIASNSMTFNKDTSITTFIGGVVLTSQGVLLKSDRLASKNYKDSAEATGHVRAFYKQQKTAIKCGRIVYGKEMSNVKAYENVVAEKFLDNGNTITMYCDRADFDTEHGSITAEKVKKRVKVTMKDIVAFSDKVVYNDETGDLLMTGKPMVEKDKSAFLASRITVDTIKKTMRLENDIWSRLLYGDFQKTKEEVSIETDKHPAPR